MAYEHGLSIPSPLLLAALGLLAVWPFRRKDAADAPNAEATLQGDEADPEIDHLDWGIRLGMLERYERAAERFRMAVQTHPEDPVGHYNLALALDLADRHEEARDSYQQAIHLDSNVPDAHINLSLTLSDLGDRQAAISALNAALVLAPDDAVAHYDLGCIYMALGMWRKAADAFRASNDANPKEAQTRFNSALALRRAGDSAAAERELRDFLALARGRYPRQKEYAEQILRTQYADTGDQDVP